MTMPMETITRIEEKVDELHNDVQELKKILLGNALIKADTGFVGRMIDLEARLMVLEKWKYTLIVVITVAGLLSGWKITELLAKLK